MRALLFSLVLVPSVAQADVFHLTSAPDRVTVHPGVARVGRTLELELPAGQHELRLSDLPQYMAPAFVDVRLSGAQLVSQTLRASPQLTEQRLKGSEAVEKARRNLQAAEESLAQHKDRIGVQLAQIEAAEAQIAFLEGLGEGDLTGDQLDTAQLRALGQAIAEDGAGARAVIVEARAQVRALEQNSQGFEDRLKLARDAYMRVVEPFEAAQELSLIVSASQPGRVTLEVDYTSGNVSWEPSYRMFLDSETGALQVERLVTIRQGSGEDWSGVDLSVTTIPVLGQSAPSWLNEQRLRIIEEEAIAKQGVRLSSRDLSRAEVYAEPTIEAPVIVTEVAVPSFSGAGVSYSFGFPVAVANGDDATIALPALQFEAEISARAVPFLDETAYRIVSLTNETGERVLQGDAELYVDGLIVGSDYLTTIEAGAEADLGFGPIHGLQLKRTVLEREEGDAGFIARENREEQDVRISVENLTEMAWDVTLMDRVPFSEQEDLTINWTASPKASRENVEDRRGILEWDLRLAPGQSQDVRLTTDIRWPEGQVLR